MTLLLLTALIVLAIAAGTIRAVLADTPRYAPKSHPTDPQWLPPSSLC